MTAYQMMGGGCPSLNHQVLAMDNPAADDNYMRLFLLRDATQSAVMRQ